MIYYSSGGKIQDVIDPIGRGQGANKTTTSVYGITVSEDFGVGDELFFQWQVPVLWEPLLGRPVLHMSFAPVTAEVGKLFSLEISLSSQEEGDLLSDTGTVFSIVDAPIPSTALETFGLQFEIPGSIDLSNGFDDLHVKLKRIASSNDLVGDVALHHMSMDYFRKGVGFVV